MLEMKKRLARLLIEKSYLEGDFTLTSGQKSDYYFDCKHTALHPEGSWLIGRFFLDMIRKQPKGHGTNQYLEGLNNFEPGMNVCLLEDVITTGGTLLKAVDRVREQGLNIVAIMGVLDREQGGRENIAKAGFELETIFTRKELVETARM
jgi:orotate phosphoribosyltransferase